MARNVGRDLPESLIFSCMALGQTSLSELDSWPARPGVIEWMPRQTKPGSHPSWKEDGFALRDPTTGRIIPRLLRMFGRNDPKAIAAFGFSAGSNSGVRELLRDSTDRESLSFVAAIDGLHAAMASPTIHKADDVTSYFLDWKGQVAPFAEYALRAARGQCTMVMTGNNLAEPARGLTRSPFAIRKVFEWVEKQSGVLPYDEAASRRFADLGEPAPFNIFGAGKLYCFTYAGTQKEDHRAQAKVIAPRILKNILLPLWTGKGES